MKLFRGVANTSRKIERKTKVARCEKLRTKTKAFFWAICASIRWLVFHSCLPAANIVIHHACSKYKSWEPESISSWQGKQQMMQIFIYLSWSRSSKCDFFPTSCFPLMILSLQTEHYFFAEGRKIIATSTVAPNALTLPNYEHGV